MRILGKGKTALSLKEIFKDAVLYDDNDIDIFDINSDELTVVSPGIPPNNFLVKNSKKLVSDYDLLLNNNHFSIWISGTNGKTTTTQMISSLLKRFSFFEGGNIGIPLSKIYKQKRIILETSSFTLHYTKKAKPNIYVLLPITYDHISWHGSFKEYEKAKLSVLDRLNENDIAIVPKKYQNIKSDGMKIYYNDEYDLSKEFNIDLKKLKFKKPFLLDATLALSVYKILFCDIDEDILNNFKIDKHKLETIIDNNKYIWINDSKATNIDATIQALLNFKDKDINLIIGGDIKGQDFNEFFKKIKNFNIKLFIIGSMSDILYDLAKKYSIKSNKCYTLKNAVLAIKKVMKKGDVNILSPASSSLDQFNSYKQRGEEFRRLVYDLD